jgi:hypothetical protein
MIPVAKQCPPGPHRLRIDEGSQLSLPGCSGACFTVKYFIHIVFFIILKNMIKILGYMHTFKNHTMM